jgi:uncharacterized membrane protein
MLRRCNVRGDPRSTGGARGAGTGRRRRREYHRIMEIRSVDAGRGAAWLTEGLDIFKRAPMHWIGITLLLLLFTVIASRVPLIGPMVLQLLGPVFTAGLLLGCRTGERGEGFRVAHLFAGFSDNVGQLVLVAVIYFLGAVIITVVVLVVMFSAIAGLQVSGVGNPEQLQQMLAGNFMLVLLSALVGLALSIPLLMALWFAPALIVFDRLNAIDAMLTSFRGCLANIVPFLVYGVLALVLSIAATIPLMLGWLVLLPVVIASIYIGYRDIFATGGDGA